tara:strand:- start:270 stop:1301 length:1032 start_codon:yes stop_codon:yes gene_type:complete
MEKFKITSYEDISKKEWDESVSNLNGCRWKSTSNQIEYYCNLSKTENISFLIKDESKNVISIVPLALHKDKTKSFSFGGTPCSKPLLQKKIDASRRRKILLFIKETIEIMAKKNNVKKYIVDSHPVVYLEESNIPQISSKNQFDLNFWTGKIALHNTLIVECSKSLIELEDNLSKYRKRDIKRSLKKLEIKSYNYKCDHEKLNRIFANYKNCHFKKAKVTRPDKSWQIMKERIIDNQATLFVSYLNKSTEISYLYCGHYEKFAWGWSQVNDLNYEKEFQPRHSLEWEAINYFKKNNFLFYDIGERYNIAQNFLPTLKQLSISDFKEKYGTALFPKPVYEFEFR